VGVSTEIDMIASFWSRGGWRLIGWGTATVILLLPVVARAPWTLSDFIVMGGLLASALLSLELAVRASEKPAYRTATAVAVAAAFLLSWIDLAVGFVGLVFLGILAVAIAGAFVAKLQPDGMARAMAATAVMQVLVGVGAMVVGRNSADVNGTHDTATAIGTIFFATLWLISAGLFRKAARG
jgi:hypothetical protein